MNLTIKTIENEEEWFENMADELGVEKLDVDVDEDGPFITPESDSGSSIMGGDTGVDADFIPGPNHRPIIENEKDWLDYMANELAAEKYVEMGYENGVEPEVYA